MTDYWPLIVYDYTFIFMVELRDLVEGAGRGARSAPELALVVLREAILCGRLPAGSALRQDELAAGLGVSKIPVREALRRLEGDGLVEFQLNRGAVVAALSLAEARELGEMRVALETMALRAALGSLGAGDLRRAGSLVEELDWAADVAGWSRLNRELHLTLYGPAGRPQLLATIHGLHLRADRYMRLVLGAAGHQPRSQEEHRALLGACAARDVEGALAILTAHIEGATWRLAAHLERAAEGAGGGDARA
jgi:DNA-binding GntR family transcriptional regulator